MGLQRKKQRTKKNIKGLEVRNRLGLAAGLDKNGELIEEMSNLGFGFIEIGTVTPKNNLEIKNQEYLESKKKNLF